MAQDRLLRSLQNMSAISPASASLVNSIADAVEAGHSDACDRAAAEISARLQELECRIDDRVVHRNEFVDLYKNTRVIVHRTQYDEKIRAAANILANACLRDSDAEKLPYTELDYFTRCVESLSIGAIRMLGEFLAFRFNTRADPHEVDLDHICGRHEGPLDRDLALGLFRELDAFNLIELRIDHMKINDRRRAKVIATALGSRFQKFALSPNSVR